VLQDELGCGRKFGRCAIGCSACWQNVDGGLAGTVSANGLGTSKSHVLWSVHTPQRSFVRIVHSVGREQHQTAVAMMAMGAGSGACTQTTRSTRLAPSVGQLHWNPESASREPVECHQKATPSLSAPPKSRTPKSSHAASRQWRGHPAAESPRASCHFLGTRTARWESLTHCQQPGVFC
jgi:hypothetical protein